MITMLRVAFFISLVFWVIVTLIGMTPVIVGIIFIIGSTWCLAISDGEYEDIRSRNR